MTISIDTQTKATVLNQKEKYYLSLANKTFSNMEKIHNYLQKTTSFDTIKICLERESYYLHFSPEESQVFPNKQALRRNLSRETGGAWAENKGGLIRYFIEEKVCK
ncbi:MAG: hypothetical protein K940chlam9_01486 [Chlamydiae bacterium]|nr:hypothetical protein [Chlamydiota bacterium]